MVYGIGNLEPETSIFLYGMSYLLWYDKLSPNLVAESRHIYSLSFCVGNLGVASLGSCSG